MIAAGAGNDTVTYRGSEASIDGGADLDTLILAASGGTTAINLSVAAGADRAHGGSPEPPPDSLRRWIAAA